MNPRVPEPEPTPRTQSGGLKGFISSACLMLIYVDFLDWCDGASPINTVPAA